MKQGISQAEHWRNYALLLINALRVEHGWTNRRIGKLLGISGEAITMIAPRKDI